MLFDRYVYVCTVLMVILSIGALCLIFNIYDFVVTSKLYYSLPNKTVLLYPDDAYLLYLAAGCTLVVSFISLLLSNASEALQRFAVKYQLILSLLHGAILVALTLAQSYAGFCCADASKVVGRYAYEASPAQFQEASHWYFTRLRILYPLFLALSVVTVSILAKLYFGVNVEYLPFRRSTTKKNKVQKSQKQKNIDLVEKTTYFA